LRTRPGGFWPDPTDEALYHLRVPRARAIVSFYVVEHEMLMLVKRIRSF
jgi:hypothetical protein